MHNLIERGCSRMFSLSTYAELREQGCARISLSSSYVVFDRKGVHLNIFVE